MLLLIISNTTYILLWITHQPLLHGQRKRIKCLPEEKKADLANDCAAPSRSQMRFSCIRSPFLTCTFWDDK